MALYNTLPSATQQNQTTQITLEQDIRDSLVTAPSPAANTLQARVQGIIDRLGEVQATPSGNTVLARLLALWQSIGAPTDTSATSDTGNFSAIAFLKRIATTLSAIATNTSTSITTTTATAASVSVAQASIQLLASGTRKSYSLYNSGANTVFLEYGAAPTTSVYTMPLPPGFLYVDDFGFTGVINAIAASGTNTVLVRSFN